MTHRSVFLAIVAAIAGSIPLRAQQPARIDTAVVDSIIRHHVAEKRITGVSVGIMQHGAIVFARGYGTADLETRRPVTASTMFAIGSVTKQFTCSALLMLQEEGKLSLSDPVSKYFPGVPKGDKITIAELLKMRSGLYNYTDAPELSASLDRVPTRVWSPHEVLAIAFKHPPYFPPGTAFRGD